MDLNIVVLAGVLSADPDFRELDSGATLLRCLVTTRTDIGHRRVDAIPVTLWDPDPALQSQLLGRGQPVWVAGSVQRRFWTADDGRHSRVEVVARTFEVRDPEDESHVDLVTFLGEG